MHIDDILVTGQSNNEHLDHLVEVLRRLTNASTQSKCAFLLPSIEYLGHTITAESLHTSDAKVSGILRAPAPHNVTELCSFLGLVNYHREVPSRHCYHIVTTLCTTTEAEEVGMRQEARASLPGSKESSEVNMSTNSLQ